jgi:Secretion system C-terminal sorting domain
LASNYNIKRMRSNYINLLILLFYPVFINAQILWGVGSSTGVANAEFSNAFVQATSFTAGNNVGAWTALSVTVNAYWVRNTTRISRGGSASGMTALNSPSASNGSALFDSDFLDCNGVQGAYATGTCPSPHKGHIISPQIDLTGYSNTPISVRFYSYLRKFDISELSISFSTDDGVTWGSAVAFANRPALNATFSGYETLNLPATTTNGVANLSACRLRFTFNGDYYYSFVDDVSIGTTATLSNYDVDGDFNTLKIHPNPTQNQVFIEANNLIDASLQILDINGRVVKSQKLNGTNNNINLESFKSGVYLFKILSNEGVTTKKVVKI